MFQFYGIQQKLDLITAFLIPQSEEYSFVVVCRPIQSVPQEQYLSSYWSELNYSRYK